MSRMRIEIYSKGEIIEKVVNANWYTQEQGFFHLWHEGTPNQGPILSINQIRVASIRRVEWRSIDEDRRLPEERLHVDVGKLAATEVEALRKAGIITPAEGPGSSGES